MHACMYVRMHRERGTGMKPHSDGHGEAGRRAGGQERCVLVIIKQYTVVGIAQCAVYSTSWCFSHHKYCVHAV